jgi:hypothetical protein
VQSLLAILNRISLKTTSCRVDVVVYCVTWKLCSAREVSQRPIKYSRNKLDKAATKYKTWRQLQ